MAIKYNDKQIIANASSDIKFDVIIIGGGIAGLTAALFLARANINVCYFEKKVPGGKVVNVPDIANIPCFAKIDGAKYASAIYSQVNSMNVKYFPYEIKKIVQSDDKKWFFIYTKIDKLYIAKVLIIATGTDIARLNIPGEDRLQNKGISYCTLCDGTLARAKTVCVVGTGYKFFIITTMFYWSIIAIN